MNPIWLYVVRGNDQGRRFEIDSSQQITIGRGRSNLICLVDEETSRSHAEIVFTEEGVCVRDLGSSNGTYVNGTRVNDHLLRRGDQIEVGQTAFLVGPVLESEQESDRGALSSSISSDPGTDSSVSVSTPFKSEQLVGSVKSDLQFMYHVALATSHPSEVDQMLEKILDLVFEWVDVERGCVLLWNSKHEKYEARATRYRSTESKLGKLKISKSIIKYVLEQQEGILTADAGIDERLDGKESIKTSGVKAAMCVPIRGRSKVHGFIYADTIAATPEVPKSADTFRLNQDHLKLMLAIGHQVAVFIENEKYCSAIVKSERLTAVGQTLATLSHHVKNILQSINGGTHLIEDGLEKNDVDVIKQGWSIVKRNQGNLANLVMDMVSFSKPNLPHWKKGNLNQTIRESIQRATENSGSSIVTIHWEPNPDFDHTFHDAPSMSRAIENVLRHMLDNCSSSRACDVHIVSSIKGRNGVEFVVVNIQNNFQELSSTRLAALFKPFAFEDENEVYGIGLAVTRKILNEHGGGIEASRRRIKGLNFQLFFPIRDGGGDHPTCSFQVDDAKGLTSTR